MTVWICYSRALEKRCLLSLLSSMHNGLDVSLVTAIPSHPPHSVLANQVWKKPLAMCNFILGLEKKINSVFNLRSPSKRCAPFWNLAAQCSQQPSLPIGGRSAIHWRFRFISHNPGQIFLWDSVGLSIHLSRRCSMKLTQRRGLDHILDIRLSGFQKWNFSRPKMEWNGTHYRNLFMQTADPEM